MSRILNKKKSSPENEPAHFFESRMLNSFDLSRRLQINRFCWRGWINNWIEKVRKLLESRVRRSLRYRLRRIERRKSSWLFHSWINQLFPFTIEPERESSAEDLIKTIQGKFFIDSIFPLVGVSTSLCCWQFSKFINFLLHSTHFFLLFRSQGKVSRWQSWYRRHHYK